MGIGSIVRKTARKAADFAENGISAASELSPDQLKDIEAKRNAYLTAMPDPSPGNEIAQELTSRLLAAASVELQNSYLPQISELYLPVDRNLEMGDGGFDTSHNVRSIHIDKWVDNPDENGLEKLVNVYGTLADENCNVALIFHRTADSVDVSIAVADLNNAGSSVEADNLCARLESSLRGNFPGSSWGPVGTVPKCLDNAAVYSVASATNIPTEKSEKFVSQTIEKLLDGIVPDSKRTEYTLILLATPIWDVEERKARLAELYSALTPYSTWQTNYQVSENTSLGSTATVSVNVGASAGIQVGINDSIAKASSKSDSSSQAASRQTSQTNSDTASEANTDTDSINAGVDAGGSIVRAHVDTSHSTSTTKSLSKTLSETVGKSVTDTLGKAVTKGFTSTTGQSKSNSFGVNAGMSFARSSSSTATIGRNEGITQNFGNYAIKHALEILEQQTKRYEQSTALGLWDFAAYVLSEDVNTARNVAHTYLALTQGPDSNLSTAAVNVWRGDGGPQMGAAASICGYLRELRHPLFGLDPAILESEDEETKAYCVYPATVTATTALSGKELAYSLNFPKKSVPGLPVIECAAFGRNVSTFDGTQPTTGLTLGKVFHMHREEPVKVLLQKDSLASHVFVTGSTGAGKTNTVCRILDQALEKDVKFLVVEPAKGEYKSVYGGVEGVRVFGTNPAAAPLLRINPFSFPEGVHVLEHLDRLVEIFNVCWPMYAAMPAVLKDAVSRSYADCGWDLATSENPFGPGLWPTFADVARNVREILDERVRRREQGRLQGVAAHPPAVAHQRPQRHDARSRRGARRAALRRELRRGPLPRGLGRDQVPAHGPPRGQAPGTPHGHLPRHEPAAAPPHGAGGGPQPAQAHVRRTGRRGRKPRRQERGDDLQRHRRDAHLRRGLRHRRPGARPAGHGGHPQHQHQNHHAPARPLRPRARGSRCQPQRPPDNRAGAPAQGRGRRLPERLGRARAVQGDQGRGRGAMGVRAADR